MFCEEMYYFTYQIKSPGGEIGRHKGLKIPRTLRLYRFKSGLGHHLIIVKDSLRKYDKVAT